jgi:redox-sensitive bicupin YhaK (pirin superfamily)
MLGPERISDDGPARVLLGSYGTATSAIKAPSPMNYLAVRFKAGQRWTYQPPTEHTVIWTAVGMGSVLVPDELPQGELVAFSPSSAAIEFEAQFDAEFVLGPAVHWPETVETRRKQKETVRAQLLIRKKYEQ